MPRHVEVDDMSLVARDHEQAAQSTEDECRRCEEIHRGNRLAMIAQKCCPAYYGIGVTVRHLQEARHGSFGNVKGQHPPLALNARRTRALFSIATRKIGSRHLLLTGLPAPRARRRESHFNYSFGAGFVPTRHSVRLEG